jgi:hypothetical protein
MKIVTNDGTQCVALWRNALLQIARKELATEDIGRFEGALEELLASCPSGVAIVTLVEETAGAPQGQAREAMAKIAKAVAWGVACNAVIIEGDGFQAAAKRGYAASINWLIRRSFPHHIFATVDEAAPWISRHAPPYNRITMRPADVCKAFEDLRLRAPMPASGPVGEHRHEP